MRRAVQNNEFKVSATTINTKDEENKPIMIHLRGITWNHTRGYLPMVATAQLFSEQHPDVHISWEVRSLQQFADLPIQDLAKQFDLLVIDHPFAGYAEAHHVLVPLDDYIAKPYLDDQLKNSVGLSHISYQSNGHQLALAIDAAAPVSGWRPDLLARANAAVPQTWSELLELASRGIVAIPAIPIDSLMNFYMLCSALGEDPFRSGGKVVSHEIGVQSLKMLRELTLLCAPECFQRNPIATWQMLSSGDTIAYCPFAYGYSNYSRRGYANHVLQAGELIEMSTGVSCRSTLGGTGLAVSASCLHKELAVEYSTYVASRECQRSLYFDSGGQPGYRAAWLDDEVNQRSNNFFSAILPTLDAAFLRPTFCGYLTFQDYAGPVIHVYLQAGGDERVVLNQLDDLYIKARKEERNG